mmetsp:Transcript_3371/g.8004  ORF Transcript_3371/g.8004 Transcript_3371/m.8004 type:complete len:84 (-) Transcript_3371:28-279(-)
MHSPAAKMRSEQRITHWNGKIYNPKPNGMFALLLQLCKINLTHSSLPATLHTRSQSVRNSEATTAAPKYEAGVLAMRLPVLRV